MRNNAVSKLTPILAIIDANPTDFELGRLKEELLIFAVQVGSIQMIKYIVEHNLVDDINFQDSSGNTALHLAAISNRDDVIDYLMQIPDINDCILNKQLKQPFQCTNNIEIAQLMDQMRMRYVEKITGKLRAGFDTRDFNILNSILSNSRNKELLDINGTDPFTGDTILLEFIKKNDLEMVKFILDHGADPFKRSISGKSPEESATNPEMKALIEDFFSKQNIMDSTSKPQEGSPTFKGFLKKWTNFAGGYRLRWFVLDKEARLSYYKSPNDMNNTCRGMIHLAHAQVRVDSSENTKFEIIIQNPSDGSPVRWHLKSEHATETQKWVWVLQNAITYAKDLEKKHRKSLPKTNILNEEPLSSPLSVQSGLPFKHHLDAPITIPETRSLNSAEIAEDRIIQQRKVLDVVDEAQNAAHEFRQLINETDSENELPLNLSTATTKNESRNNDASIENNQIENTNDSDRLRPGPGPDRTTIYGGPPPKIRTSLDSQRSAHSQHSFSSHTKNNSISSINSEHSGSSKNSKTKKITKKLHRLSRFGRKKKIEKRDFYDGDHSMQESNSSMGEYDDDEELDDDIDHSIFGGSSELLVIRNQMKIQLETFRDFLKQASKDERVTKHELADNCTGILNTLESLINKEGESVNEKYNELVRKLDKQHKISSIWENSIKKLEFEIKDRETKIVELEDKLKAVKKSLRNSMLLHSNSKDQLSSQTINNNVNTDNTQFISNSNSVASLARAKLSANIKPSIVVTDSTNSVPVLKKDTQQVSENHTPLPTSATTNTSMAQKSIALDDDQQHIDTPPLPSISPPPLPTLDPTLTEFLEEEDDSDDEFFDAEDESEIKDMYILEQIETEKVNDDSSIAAPVKTVAGSKGNIKEDESKGKTEEKHNDIVEKAEDNAEPANNLNKSDETNTKSANLGDEWFQPAIKDDHYVVNSHQLVNKQQISRYEKFMKERTFNGYQDPLRTSLAPEDNRPKISLWGVLKSLVGKDMTRMTLPVSFNEPTSLLQRNVEVIEYSDLLDKASTIDSSTLRMVYVASFAASEYASTVGRIAKPFNPLLGETFEYARPDKGYRCFVEQVSHHPPISALIAESPSWSYYGESNVKTQFYGRSFDIKHLGTWFCELFPDHGVKTKSGEHTDMELYSWRKVNNSVIGIVVGNPQIDNYGEMEIRNYMTGDYMRYKFKPRGWRASSAYEVKGEVFSADGKLRYYVGGHWNDKIFCKPANDQNAEKFLIWEAAPRKEMMFHLTNFAATLNAPLPHLLPVVACTDTRLRPDQRAMENGDYDNAAKEKDRVEQKQRAARKERELRGETYSPYFFKRSRHPVTGDEFWSYGGDYWNSRNEGKLKSYHDIF